MILPGLAVGARTTATASFLAGTLPAGSLRAAAACVLLAEELGRSQTLRELARVAGRQLDPDLVPLAALLSAAYLPEEP